MLKILSGNHSFLRAQALLELKEKVAVRPVNLAVENLTVTDWTDLLLAQSLFEPRRFLLAYGLSENTAVWQKMTEMAEQIAADDSLLLVLVEDKLDSRTKFAKIAKTAGWLTEFNLKTDKSGRVVDYSGDLSVKFVLERATKRSLPFERSVARYLFDRVGAEPWDLYQAVERLADLGEASREMIDKYIPANNMVNLFEILTKALLGQAQVVAAEVDQLAQTSTEPHQFFGLLTTQMLNVLALVAAPAEADVAGELGINQFMLDKLRTLAGRVSLPKVKQAVQLFTETDQNLKTSSSDIWLEIKTLLLQVAQIK